MLFFRRGRSSSIWLPTVADPTKPSLATEVNGTGVNLSAAVTAIAGFETTLNRISAPVQAYPQELQISGPQTFADSTLTFLEDDGTGTDADALARQSAFTVLAEGSTGWLLLHPNKASGFAIGDKVELWPLTVGTRNRSFALDTSPASFVAAFSVEGQPIRPATLKA